MISPYTVAITPLWLIKIVFIMSYTTQGHDCTKKASSSLEK